MSVRVIGPRDPPDPSAIDTTSRSRTWSRGLSPFFLGPAPLYEGAKVAESLTVENAWQYAKVYPQHLDPWGDPTPTYFTWAAEGWRNPSAVRYPMGKGARPEYSWWAGERLAYIEARKRIYIPLYAKAVAHTAAFQQLLATYRSRGEVTLWDFDGYDRGSRSLLDVVNDPVRTMGHAFVLALLLEKLR